MMERGKVYSAAYTDRAALCRSYMSFLAGGGLFRPLEARCGAGAGAAAKLGAVAFVLVCLPGSAEIRPASGRVVWLNPKADGAQRPMGIGVALDKNESGARLVAAIEAQLGAMLKSPEPTYTLWRLKWALRWEPQCPLK